MILVDTGFLLALFQQSDELHDRANQWSVANRDHLLVTEFVLLETYNQLSKPHQRPRVQAIQTAISQDPQIEIVRLNTRLFADGLTLHRNRPDKEWSLTDCVSFTVMQKRGITAALAHDHHFIQAGFDALLRRDP